MVGLVLTFWPLAGQYVATGRISYVDNDTLKYHYGTSDGLPNRIVYGAAYDSRHLLWAATQRGLCRYDGNQFVAYTQFKQLFHGPLHPAPDGWLYAITRLDQDSLEGLDPGALRAVGLRPPGQPSAGFYHAGGQPPYLAANALLYPVSEGLLLRPRPLPLPTLPGDRLIFADSTDFLMASPERGKVYGTLNGRDLDLPLPSTERLANSYVSVLGDVWLVYPKVTYVRFAGRPNFVLADRLEDGEYPNFFTPDRSGNLLLGYIHPTRLTIQALRLRLADGSTGSATWLPRIEDRIIDISGEDFTRQINLSTHGGLWNIRLPAPRPTPFRNYLYEGGLRENTFGQIMRGFAADDDGNVYTIKDSSKPDWFRVNPATHQLDTLYLRNPDGSLHQQFGCGTNVLNFRGDIYWQSCSMGAADTAYLYRYYPASGKLDIYELPDPGQRIRLSVANPAGDGLLLFTQDMSAGNRNGRIYDFDPTTEKYTERLPKMGAPNLVGEPKAVDHAEGDATYYVASTGGAYRYHYASNTLERYAGDYPFSAVEIVDTSIILFGTYGSGVFNLDAGTGELTAVARVPNDDEAAQGGALFSLPSNDIASILYAENHLLITTFNGLVVHGPDRTSTYTVTDGLPDNEFNTLSLFYNAFDSSYYAGGINGFTHFHLEELKPRRSEYWPTVLRYRSLDENIGGERSVLLSTTNTPRIEVAPSVVYFSLDFIMPEYTGPSPKTFQTRLIGLDPDWRTPSQETSVRYTRLPPGEYTFQLRATDGYGQPGAGVTSIPIRVLTPWYRQLWFYGLVGLLATAIVLAIHFTRIRRLRQKNAAERELHELELRNLRQQINPHFISNAMNAIREYVYRRDTEAAAGYLGDFTRLMRLFLEASRNRFMPLNQEIDLLTRYVRLEQIRFPGKFNFRVEVDEELDPSMDEIPSLLLQPIVENAINHGLIQLKEPGELVLRFGLDAGDDDVLVVQVIDNGIGRTAAALRAKTRSHTSRSTQILADRQELLASSDGIRINIATADLYPDRAHTGTVVTLRVSAAYA